MENFPPNPKKCLFQAISILFRCLWHLIGQNYATFCALHKSLDEGKKTTMIGLHQSPLTCGGWSKSRITEAPGHMWVQLKRRKVMQQACKQQRFLNQLNFLPEAKESVKTTYKGWEENT